MPRDLEDVSLWEQLKLHYQRKGYRSEASLARSSRLAAVFFVGTAVSWVYCMVFYAVPFYFADYSVQAVYWLKVTACFTFVNGMANWLCARSYSSILKETRDRPHVSKTLWDALEDGSARNGHAAEPAADYCHICCLARPPLTHHCRDCNKCVLRRDHHCYLLGKCVGYYNQRYFIVLCIYVGVASALAQHYFVHYLRANAADSDGSWLVGPHTLVRRFWSGQMPLHVALMIFQCYYLWLLGVVGVGYFGLQIEIVRRGVTMHQFRKGISPRCHRSSNENFKEVFGDFWALNFLFPAQLLFRLKPPT